MPDYAVPITLGDGKPRTLRYDWNALEALEEQGISLDSLQAVMSSPKNRMKSIRLVLWAGLIHEDEGLTARDVGRLMTPISAMTGWVDNITAAFTHAFGPSGELKNAETPGTGKPPGTGEST